MTVLRKWAVIAAIPLALLTTPAAWAKTPAPAEALKAVFAEYYRGEWRAHPVAATAIGQHAGDALLDAVGPPAVAADIARLHRVMAQLTAIDGAKLSPIARDDREVLLGQIRRQLLELETIQFWRRNPDIYVSLASNAVYPLIARATRPVAERMASVTARAAAVPAMLIAARSMLTPDAMAPVFVEVAIENSAGAAAFFRDDVPRAFAGQGSKAAQAALRKSCEAAAAALQEFHDLLVPMKPGTRGSFMIGRAALAQMLADDGVDLPPEAVLKAGEAQLARDRAAFLAVAKTIDPKGPDAALASLNRDHPDGDKLPQAAQAQLQALQDFVRTHHILTLPDATLPKVIETPPFARALITAAMDPPGPFETAGKQAFYEVTPPDPGLSGADREAFLAMFNRAILQNISVHEAMPGHFTQYQFQVAAKGVSLVRLLANSYATTEGWAHYTEQMMLDEGLGGGDPRLRLAQLQDALLRDCRLVAAFKLHMGQQTLAEASSMMEKTCFQPQPGGYREARRGTADPGYYSYTLGKLMILKLREDMRAKEGAAFSLTRFHDRFMSALLVPVPVIRREMLGDSSPPL